MNFLERKLILTAIRRLERPSPTPSPPRRGILQFLNSGLGLWLLSTVTIGAGTSLFAEYQDCKEQFSTYQERFVKLLAEYQFRSTKYKAEFGIANTDSEYALAKKWWGPDSAYIYSELEGKTISDIIIDLSRSFGNLALYSNVEGFGISGLNLELDFRDERGTTALMFEEPRQNALPPALRGILSDTERGGQQNDTTNSPSAPAQERGLLARPEVIKKMRVLRQDLYSGPLSVAVRTAALVAPRRACSLTDMAQRAFRDPEETYRQSVQRFHRGLVQEYAEFMAVLIAAEAAHDLLNTQEQPTDTAE